MSDNNQVDILRREVIKKKIDILIPPSTVVETFRLEDTSIRNQIIKNIACNPWKRLMPEAFSESEELLLEIRRLRPKWIKTRVDVTEYNANINDWKKGFWERAIKATDSLVNQYKALEANTITEAQKQAENNRKSMIEAKWVFNKTELDRIFFMSQGNDSLIVEPWRVEGKDYIYSIIQSSKDTPFNLWLRIFLNFPEINKDDWNNFWFYEVKKENMPRWWIRWAFAILSAMRKTSSGTPCDIQLSTYLFESDYIISADRIFIDITNKCKNYTPIKFASGCLVSANNTLEDIIQVLNEIG